MMFRTTHYKDSSFLNLNGIFLQIVLFLAVSLADTCHWYFRPASIISIILLSLICSSSHMFKENQLNGKKAIGRLLNSLRLSPLVWKR